jgi:hypothetical protein
MRNKIWIIVVFISVGLYAAALGIGVVRVLADMNERRAIAQQEFYDLADIASSAGALGFMGEPFQNALRDAVDSSQTLQAVIVTGHLGAEFTYERDNNGIIAWEGNSPRFRRRFGFSRNPYFSSLRINGVRNATIQALAAVIEHNAFSRILLQSLFVVLGSTALSAITLLIYHVGTKKAGLVLDRMQETYPPEQEDSRIKPAEKDGDARIKEKLDSELGLCALTDKDLALILIAPSLAAGFDDEADIVGKVSDRAEQFFDSRNSAQERSAQAVAIILPGESLENAFSRARQFHNLILMALPERFPRADDLRIGVSSRNGRLIRADRLFLEAARALDKAGLEPKSPVIAFKSDPEKYQAFARSNRESGEAS